MSADQQQAQRSPSGKPEKFFPLINSMFLLAIQEGFHKPGARMGAKNKQIVTPPGPYSTPLSLLNMPHLALEQETLVNLFIST